MNEYSFIKIEGEAIILNNCQIFKSRRINIYIDQNNLIEKPSFVIYPNPVRHNFVLQLNNSHTGKMNVQVVNQAGAIVRSYLFNKDQMVNQVTVPANELPTGVYFIHVQIGTWSDQRKIVKL